MIRKIVIALLIFTNALLWLIPSNVVQLISRNRHILLGRYSVERMSLLVVLIPITIFAIYILRANAQNLKKRIFQVILALFVFAIGFVFSDALLRAMRSPRYHLDEMRHRPELQQYKVLMADIPEPARTYPNLQPGYAEIACTLTIDSRGFRNLQNLEQADIVVLGDSFTEGSHVSDEHPWPVVFGQATKAKVYNLGMSGANPRDYLIIFEKIAQHLKPQWIICMIYGGNDFRASKVDVPMPDAIPDQDSESSKSKSQVKQASESKETLAQKFRNYYKSSPIVLNCKQFMINYLGPIHSKGSVAGAEIISWLPIEVAHHYYAFQPKDLMDRYNTQAEFEQHPNWLSVANIILQLQQQCQAKDIGLILVYAPTKPEVILPLVEEQLPWDQVQKFSQFAKSKLPPAPEFRRCLMENLGVQEKVLQEFCLQKSIHFVSLTTPLRLAMQQGQQVYFTYDQHWTPLGHIIAAKSISEYWQQIKK